MGDVVGTDQDHRDVRVHRKGALDLVVQLAGLGADPAQLAYVDAAFRLVRHTRPEHRARRLLDEVDPVAGRGRVAEEGDPQGRPGSPRPYQPVESGTGLSIFPIRRRATPASTRRMP
jgi:hypothetical protein